MPKTVWLVLGFALGVLFATWTEDYRANQADLDKVTRMKNLRDRCKQYTGVVTAILVTEHFRACGCLYVPAELGLPSGRGVVEAILPGDCK